MPRYLIYILLFLLALLLFLFLFPGAIPRIPMTGTHPTTCQGGDNLEVHVKCSIANCKYYSNLECTAEAIEINCDDSSMLARDSMATCCDTFTPAEDREEMPERN